MRVSMSRRRPRRRHQVRRVQVPSRSRRGGVGHRGGSHGGGGVGERADRAQDLRKVGARRAHARTTPAARAERLAEPLRIDRELVHHPLAEPRVLIAARVVPGRVQRELARLARVPVAPTHTAGRGLGLVNDVEAVAGRAHGSACSAAVAPQRERLPVRVVEVRREPRTDALGLDFKFFSTFARASVPNLVAAAPSPASSKRLACAFTSASPFAVRTSARYVDLPSGMSKMSAPRRLSGPSPTAVQKQELSTPGHARLTTVVASRRPNQRSSL